MSDEFELRIGPGGVHEIVEASPNGGSQPAISDALILDSFPGITFDTGNGWGVTWGVADLPVAAQRGTDLTVVDNGGQAALHSAAGGDFAMHAHFTLGLITLDGGSTLPRYLVPIADASPDSGDFSSVGMDAILPIIGGVGTLKAQTVCQPWFSVPPDSLVTDLLLFASCLNVTGTDTFRVGATLTIWKLGPLPT